MTPWTWLRRHRRAADEVAVELRAHVEERADDLVDSGLSPAEAHRRAAVELGNSTRVLEDVRGVWLSRMVDRVRRDLVWTWRGVRARRGRAWLACGLLAAALAINLAAFAIVDAIAFDRAPYPHARELVVFNNWMTAPALEEWRRQHDLFASVDGYFEGTTFVLGDGPTEHLGLINVTPGIFDTLGVRPRWGRTFVDDDGQRLDEQAVIVSLAFARRYFGSPEASLGRVLQTGAQPFRVVGVMPPSFRFPSTRTQIWRAIDPAGPMTRNRAGVTVVARVQRHVALAAAIRQVPDRVPAVNAAAGVKVRETHVVPYGTSAGTPGQERIFYVLLGAAVCLLLTACVNVLNMELTGALGRTRMSAIQSALGATRATLVRVTVLESLALLMASGLGAWLLASIALPAVATGLPRWLGSVAAKPFALDARAMAYGLFGCLVAWTIVALPTALYASRLDLSKPLKIDERSTSRRTGLILRRIVTVAQVSLAVVLVIVGSLFVRTYQHLMAQPKGFDSANLVGISLELPSRFYPSPASLSRLSTAIVDRLRSQPGVLDAVDGPIPPSTGNSPTSGVRMEVDGQLQERPDDRPLAVAVTAVEPRYFRLLGVPLRAGRWLTSDEAPSAALIGEGFARRFWGTPGAAVGHIFDMRMADGGRTLMWGAGPHHVVGVIADYRTRDESGPYASTAPWDELDAFTAPQPPPVEHVAAQPLLDNGGSYTFLNFLARLDSPDRAVTLAQVIKTIDPRVVVATASVDDGYADRYQLTLLLTRVVGAFAGGAFLIALVGVYGVMAFLVSGRRREIGIRMALGADRKRIGRFVMSSAIRLVVLGVGVGIAGALLTSRAIASLLFGVTPTEPSVYAGVALATIATAMLATWQPMRRASRINPVETLRAE